MKLHALTGVKSFPSLRLSENLAEAEFLAIHPRPYRWGIPRRWVKNYDFFSVSRVKIKRLEIDRNTRESVMKATTIIIAKVIADISGKAGKAKLLVPANFCLKKTARTSKILGANTKITVVKKNLLNIPRERVKLVKKLLRSIIIAGYA
ncbi:MAG: hypothetical protein V1933_01275 [Candidatus Omnitrophota bacterium]